MLNLPKCVVKQASTVPVSELVSLLPEGTPLVHVLENGIGKAKLGTGTAGEHFIGFAQNRVSAPEYAALPEKFTIPGAAPYTLKLSKRPYGTDRGVTIAGAQATVITTGTPVSGEVLIDTDGNMTFAAADAGKKFEILYRFALTATEAAFMMGYDVQFMRIPNVETTVIEVGKVYTDQYVLADNWAAPDAKAYLNDENLLTTDDASGIFVGFIIGLPSMNEGFLGVEISV